MYIAGKNDQCDTHAEIMPGNLFPGKTGCGKSLLLKPARYLAVNAGASPAKAFFMMKGKASHIWGTFTSGVKIYEITLGGN